MWKGDWSHLVIEKICKGCFFLWPFHTSCINVAFILQATSQKLESRVQLRSKQITNNPCIMCTLKWIHSKARMFRFAN